MGLFFEFHLMRFFELRGVICIGLLYMFFSVINLNFFIIFYFFQGRGGKGALYVWATGNGGVYQDNCNCDGYVSSIYTIGVDSITAHGISNYYSEPCSSKMAVVYTGGQHVRGTGRPPGNVVRGPDK